MLTFVCRRAHGVQLSESISRPSSVNLKSLVRIHNKDRNKCHTDLGKTQVCEYVPGKSKLNLLCPRTLVEITYSLIILN